jgi:hypothetical protein
MEAADLGARLCQDAARSVYACYAAVALPAVALSLSLYEVAGWLPALAIWLAKPWLDRTVLFVLSRAAFGQRTRFDDVWRAQRSVWWGQPLRTFVLQRISPWRSFVQPAYQLEGLGAWQARKRVRQLRTGRSGPAFLVTSAFALAELSLVLAVASLAIWLAPTESEFSWAELVIGEADVLIGLIIPLAYGLVVLFLEPFYVAAGFGIYLNRRSDLEAWDIEQDFRRAFAT